MASNKDKSERIKICRERIESKGKVENLKSSCPVCKKKFKNVMLHIHKKDSCKISEQEYQKLKEKSDEATRIRSRKAMAIRRERQRLEDHDALKRAQNLWKEEEWRGNEKLRRECNNYDKEISRKKAREKDPQKMKDDQNRWKRLSRKRAKEKQQEKEKSKKIKENEDLDDWILDLILTSLLSKL